VALPAYAPERRTVALLLLTAYQVLSSKPLSRGDGGVQMGQTDRRTPGRYRPRSHTARALPIIGLHAGTGFSAL